ncbi:MAG: hypothetical protein M3458_22935 [Acidobacteriota bacterium]|nr:hypothetical protein [Acidobacteriota bacterium]
MQAAIGGSSGEFNITGISFGCLKTRQSDAHRAGVEMDREPSDFSPGAILSSAYRLRLPL